MIFETKLRMECFVIKEEKIRVIKKKIYIHVFLSIAISLIVFVLGENFRDNIEYFLAIEILTYVSAFLYSLIMFFYRENDIIVLYSNKISMQKANGNVKKEILYRDIEKVYYFLGETGIKSLDLNWKILKTLLLIENKKEEKVMLNKMTYSKKDIDFLVSYIKKKNPTVALLL